MSTALLQIGQRASSPIPSSSASFLCVPLVATPVLVLVLMLVPVLVPVPVLVLNFFRFRKVFRAQSQNASYLTQHARAHARTHTCAHACTNARQ